MDVVSPAKDYTPAMVADGYVITGRAGQSHWPILRNQYGHVLPCWLTYCAMIWSLPDDADRQTYKDTDIETHIQTYRDKDSEIHRQIQTQTYRHKQANTLW